MELLRIKECYLANCYPCEIDKKTDTLRYFLRGQGWKKTKRYKIVEGVELPDRFAEISWLQIAELFDKYGIEVANCYAERKTAGIVSRRTAKGYGFVYKAIKDIIPADFSPAFFEKLVCVSMMTMFGLYLFDIIAFDKRCAEADSEYSDVDATYQGKSCSASEYVRLKFGADYEMIINRLIEKGSLDPEVQFETKPESKIIEDPSQLELELKAA